MKILFTADTHVNDWLEYSTLDKAGRPSRLMDYLKLADVMCDLAKKEDCEHIIIAGDISEASVQRPRVHDVIGDFLRKLSSCCPVHIIHGQHDTDTKEQTIMKENSILTEICKDLQEYRVHYHADTEKVKLGEFSFLFHPWNQSHTLPEETADVFVGHGMVKGCTNLDGYIFINGFDHEELLQDYRLSIIGDVHNRQLFNNNVQTRFVIQPGTPIQNTWKDAPDCGIWTAEITEDSILPEFHNIHKLAPNTFHQFLYDKENTDLIHSRPKIRFKDKKKKDTKIEVKRDLSLIRNTCFSLIEADKNADTLEALLEEVFQETDIKADKVIAKTLIKSLKIKDFLSIHEYDMSLDEFPHSCVIIGQNGGGKSSIPEAIYWCLTGNTTKDIPISNIPNKFTKAEKCSVELGLEINGQEFTIIRQRKGKSSHLELLDKEGDPFRRGSIRETQQDIYSLLGLKDWQIQMFSYFSAEKTSLFSDLGESAKNDLISQIVGLDFVERMREYSKAKRIEKREQKLKLSGVIEEKDSYVQSCKKKLSKIQEEASMSTPKIKEEIEDLQTILDSKKSNITSLKEEYIEVLGDFECEEMEEFDLKFQELSKSYHSKQSEIDTISRNKVLLEKNIKICKTKLKDAKAGTCPTCNQKLHGEEVINNLKKELSEYQDEYEDFPDLKELDKLSDKTYSELKEMESARTFINGIDKKISKKESEISELKLKMKDLTVSLEKEQDTSVVKHLQEEIEKTEEEGENLCHESHTIKILEDCWKHLETVLFKKNGELAKELNKQGSRLIQTCIDEVTTNSGITFKISNDLNLSGIFHNNQEMSYSSMSSGQRRLTDIVMMVSLNNLFSKIYNLEEGVLGLGIYDEILSFLDEKYIQTAKHIVDQSLSRKLLIITHDHSLMNLYDSRINVKMTKQGSSYRKSWK